MTIKASRADWLMRVQDIEPGGGLVISPRDGLTKQQAFEAMIAMGYSTEGQIIGRTARMGTYAVREHGTALYIKRYWDKGPNPQPAKSQETALTERKPPMPTQAEVNAARDAYRNYMQECGAPRGYLHMLHEAAIRRALGAAEAVREAPGRCQAPNGAGHTTADCPGAECRRTNECQIG